MRCFEEYKLQGTVASEPSLLRFVKAIVYFEKKWRVTKISCYNLIFEYIFMTKVNCPITERTLLMNTCR